MGRRGWRYWRGDRTDSPHASRLTPHASQKRGLSPIITSQKRGLSPIITQLFYQLFYHKEEFERLHEEIMALAKKHDRSIGALGARWGLQSEAAFRNALAGILEQHFGVQVLNVNEYDDEGVVFGRPPIRWSWM